MAALGRACCFTCTEYWQARGTISGSSREHSQYTAMEEGVGGTLE